MFKELDKFIKKNQSNIIVTGGVTDEEINSLEKRLELEFREEIREYYINTASL